MLIPMALCIRLQDNNIVKVKPGSFRHKWHILYKESPDNQPNELQAKVVAMHHEPEYSLQNTE